MGHQTPEHILQHSPSHNTQMQCMAGGGAEWEAVELRQNLGAEGEVVGGGGGEGEDMELWEKLKSYGKSCGVMGEAVELWEKL